MKTGQMVPGSKIRRGEHLRYVTVGEVGEHVRRNNHRVLPQEPAPAPLLSQGSGCHSLGENVLEAPTSGPPIGALP